MTVGDCVISRRSVRYLSEIGVGMDVLYFRAGVRITAPVPPTSFPFSMLKTENKEAATIIILKGTEGQTI